MSRLLLVVENYPNLKADASFRDLQAQVEGTENRITVARNRYIKTVQEYNTTVRVFPSNMTAMLFGYKTKANFTVEDEKAMSSPPTIKFDGGSRPAPTPTGNEPAKPVAPVKPGAAADKPAGGALSAGSPSLRAGARSLATGAADLSAGIAPYRDTGLVPHTGAMPPKHSGSANPIAHAIRPPPEKPER